MIAMVATPIKTTIFSKTLLIFGLTKLSIKSTTTCPFNLNNHAPAKKGIYSKAYSLYSCIHTKEVLKKNLAVTSKIVDNMRNKMTMPAKEANRFSNLSMILVILFIVFLLY